MVSGASQILGDRVFFFGPDWCVRANPVSGWVRYDALRKPASFARRNQGDTTRAKR